jgi:hypothetical protein
VSRDEWSPAIDRRLEDLEDQIVEESAAFMMGFCIVISEILIVASGRLSSHHNMNDRMGRQAFGGTRRSFHANYCRKLSHLAIRSITFTTMSPDTFGHMAIA